MTSPAGPLLHRSAFASRHPDEAADFLSAAYTRMRTSSTPGDYRFSHTRVASATGYALDSVFNSGPTSLQVDPSDALVVVLVESGSLRRQTGGVDQRLGPGDVFLTAAPGSGEDHSVEDWSGHTRTQVLAPQLLDRVAAEDPERDGQRRFTGVRPGSAAGQAQWVRLVRHAEQTLANPQAAGSPLVVSGLGRLLAATALLVFPNEPEPARVAGPDATVGTLRRAMTFIEAHPDAGLTAADIAQAAHVTTRAVQLAFQRHLGSTPMAYLRRVRLDQAHRELLAADPGDGTTVADVAYRWGFSSPGRFAAQYRKAYGRYPSSTLRS